LYEAEILELADTEEEEKEMEEEYEKRVTEWNLRQKQSWQEKVGDLNRHLQISKVQQREKEKDKKFKPSKIIKKRKVENEDGEIVAEARPSESVEDAN